MKDLVLGLEVLGCDYSVDVDLENGASSLSIAFAARTDDIPHRYPLSVLLTTAGNDHPSVRSHIDKTGAMCFDRVATG